MASFDQLIALRRELCLDLIDVAAQIAAAENDESAPGAPFVTGLEEIASAMEVIDQLLVVQLAMCNRASMSWDALAGEFERIGPPLVRPGRGITRQGLHARYGNLVTELVAGVADGASDGSTEDLIQNVQANLGSGWQQNRDRAVAVWERRSKDGPGWWWPNRSRINRGPSPAGTANVSDAGMTTKQRMIEVLLNFGR